MTKQRTPAQASEAVDAAVEAVIQNNLWHGAEAALDGQPKQYLADIISGKVEGPYQPTTGWRTRSR